MRRSFALIYATLKARELKTLRQLDAISKQCLNDKDVHNINISYENEATLLDNINNYGVIDLEKLNFDNNTFVIEDYICPNDDHLCSYKCIEDLTKDEPDLNAIEEAALKQITSTNDCVCTVHIRPEDVSRNFREETRSQVKSACNSSCNVSNVIEDNIEQPLESATKVVSENDDSILDMKKIEPTDEWLNSIKNQTETEPTQTNDLMEHSTIVCS